MRPIFLSDVFPIDRYLWKNEIFLRREIIRACGSNLFWILFGRTIDSLISWLTTRYGLFGRTIDCLISWLTTRYELFGRTIDCLISWLTTRCGLFGRTIDSLISWLTTRCGPYFGITVEAVQRLTYQTGWNVRTCKKRQNMLCFGVCRRKNFFTLSPSYAQSPKNREKSLCSKVLELRWIISTWWDENMTLFVFSASYETHWNWFCGRKQTKNAKIRRGALLREGCFDRKEYLSNTANKRCSRQMLQLQCS